jgi:hypothetical protein
MILTGKLAGLDKRPDHRLFIALYKLGILLFNLVPYVALRIAG